MQILKFELNYSFIIQAFSLTSCQRHSVIFLLSKISTAAKQAMKIDDTKF